MFGLKFIKTNPTLYLLQFRRGQVVRQGTGLSFLYYAPTSSLVGIPVATAEAPFIFEEITADFQSVTIQGQLTYRVADPLKLAAMMNYTLDPGGQHYLSDDPDKLPQRIINVVKVLVRSELQKLSLRQAMQTTDTIVPAILQDLSESKDILSLGLEILGLSILAIKPTPETSRALEAEMREHLLQEADEAIYARRNSAVQQERAIRENELNTEIAVENKKRQIRETQMEAERSVQEKEHELEAAAMTAKTSLEEQRKQWVSLASENAREEADARAYGVSTSMQAISAVDPKVLQALASVGMKPEQLIAVAFQELAGKADKIGQLNITPDLLRELMGTRETVEVEG